MKTDKKYLLLGILFGVALLLVILSIFPAKASVSPNPKSTLTPEILPNGWYRFTDVEAGYSFDYPPNSLHISHGKNKGEKYDHLFIQFPEIKGYGSQGMVLFVEPNTKKFSPEEFLIDFYARKTKKSSLPTLSNTDLGEIINVGGKSAIKTNLLTSELPSTFSYHVIFVSDDKAFITGPTYGSIGASEVAPESEELFMQVLNTFTFHK